MDTQPKRGRGRPKVEPRNDGFGDMLQVADRVALMHTKTRPFAIMWALYCLGDADRPSPSAYGLTVESARRIELLIAEWGGLVDPSGGLEYNGRAAPKRKRAGTFRGSFNIGDWQKDQKERDLERKGRSLYDAPF